MRKKDYARRSSKNASYAIGGLTSSGIKRVESGCFCWIKNWLSRCSNNRTHSRFHASWHSAKFGKRKKQGKGKIVISFLFSFVKNAATALVVFLLFFAVFLTLIWVFFSSFFHLKQSVLNLYIIHNYNGSINKIYFAFFDANTQSVQFFSSDIDYEFSFLDLSENKIEKETVNHFFNKLSKPNSLNGSREDWEINLIKASWMAERLVNNVVSVSADEVGQLTSLEESSNPSIQSRARIALAAVRDWSVDDESSERSYSPSFLSNFFEFPKKIRFLLTVFSMDWQPVESIDNSSVLPELSLTTNQAAQCALAVVNTTQVSGYASKISAILENSGARVVRVGNLPGAQDRHMLYFSQKGECAVMGRIFAKRILPGKVEYYQGKDADPVTSRYRADVVIMLGGDNSQE